MTFVMHILQIDWSTAHDDLLAALTLAVTRRTFASNIYQRLRIDLRNSHNFHTHTLEMIRCIEDMNSGWTRSEVVQKRFFFTM